MRGQDLLEKIEGIDPAYVEAADAKPKAARRWVKWGALAACAVLALAGFGILRQPYAPKGGDDCIRVSENGVTIPEMKLSLSADAAADMIGFFIYQGRCYVQYERIDHPQSIVGDYLGTATGLIDEWTPKEGYVELAGSVAGDFYAVEGYDPAFLLCMKEEDGAVSTYLCNTGITLKYGSELYEDRLHLSENYEAILSETPASWFDSKGERYPVEDSRGVVDSFLAQLNAAEFMPWSQVALDDSMLYLVTFRMKNGTTVSLLLYENGYVRFAGVSEVCVQVPQDTFRSLIRLLENPVGASDQAS